MAKRIEVVEIGAIRHNRLEVGALKDFRAAERFFDWLTEQP